jgi:hypothetical protein
MRVGFVLGYFEGNSDGVLDGNFVGLVLGFLEGTSLGF